MRNEHWDGLLWSALALMCVPALIGGGLAWFVVRNKRSLSLRIFSVLGGSVAGIALLFGVFFSGIYQLPGQWIRDFQSRDAGYRMSVTLDGDMRDLRVERALTTLAFTDKATIRKLELDGLGQAVMPSALEGFPMVRELSLRDVSLGASLRDLVRELPALERLSLISVGSSLADDTFAENAELRVLVIFSEGQWEIADHAFRGLRHLEELEVYGHMRIPSAALRDVAQLRRLKVQYGNHAELGPATFEGLSALQNIELVWMHVERIEPGAFAKLAALRTIEIRESVTQGGPIIVSRKDAGLAESVNVDVDAFTFTP